MTHKESDHWKFYNQDVTRKKNVFPNKGTGNDGNDYKGSNKNMSLSDNLKAAMMTKFKCSDADADKLWTEVVGNKQDF